MEFKSLFSGAILALFMAPASGQDIYKCVDNGKIRYSEEKCGDSAEIVTLKELAAPVKEVSASAIEGQDSRNKISSLEYQIKRHEKRIRKYQKKMQYELGILEKRAGIREKETSSQLQNISASADQEVIAEQMTALTNHYKLLIEAEEFRIRTLERNIDRTAQKNATHKQ